MDRRSDSLKAPDRELVQDKLTESQALSLTKVPEAFFRREATLVAPDMLGLILVHHNEEGVTAGIITEAEAYQGPEDRACHAYNWTRTPRNEPLYGPPGYSYVYFCYGMHYLFNVVTMEEGVPHGVLVRSLQPVTGQALMLKRRRGRTPLAQGPGRLCQAMGIGRLQNGVNLRSDRLFIAYPPQTPQNLVPEFFVKITPRIGVDYAGEAKDYPWRFVLQPKSG
jgi:DNA-3-methyladenine glycosylase